MRASSDNIASAASVVCFVLLAATMPAFGYNYDYGGVDYAGPPGANGGDSYDGANSYYAQLPAVDDSEPANECYVCHYRHERDHQSGQPGCDHPFDPSSIHVVPCDGPCGRTRTYLGDHGYMITRSCHPDCEDTVDEVSIVRCCEGSLCNTAPVVPRTATVLLLTSAVLSLLSWVL